MPEPMNDAAGHPGADTPDDQQLAVVVWAVDPDLGLSFWPMPLGVARFWTRAMTPAALDLANPLLVQPVLERLEQSFPCPPESGWSAHACEGHLSHWTSWLVEIPTCHIRGLGIQGTIERLDQVRQTLLPDPAPAVSWTFPPVVHYPAEQRPTGRMVATMDDTLNEVTLDLALKALKAHVLLAGERRTLRDAVAGTPLDPGTGSSRPRARL